MKSSMSVLCVLIMSILIGCSPISVKNDFDHTEDFSTYKTFSLFAGELPPGDALSRYPEMKERIYPVVVEILQEKGFVYQESGEADFIVHIRGALRAQTQRTKHGGVSWRSSWWGGSRSVVSYYDEGSLLIDIINTKNKNLSWRGIGSKIASQSRNIIYDKVKLKKALAKILKGFPPK